MKTLRTVRGTLGLVALTFAAGCTSDPVDSISGTERASGSFANVLSTVVVKPSTLNGACQTLAAPVVCWSTFPSGWLFYNDENEAGDPSLGSFVAGPGSPANGSGSAQISVSGTQRRNLATYQFAGTPLASVTALSFRTYNPSAGNGGSANRSAYLHFNADFNGTDTWQRRLVFVPSQNGTVVQDTWQEWDAYNGGNALWSYSGATWPVTGEPGGTLKTWNQILSDYPGIRVRVTDAFLGMRVGDPYSDGYTEDIDSFTFGTAGGTTLFDFEPETLWGSCAVNDNGSSYTLLADCTTSQTLVLPNGYTLYGAGFRITAVDPGAGQFKGAVIKNGGASANITNVKINAGSVTGCYGGDDRLRAILFENAGGAITNVTIESVRRNPLNGCQEGNGIDVRNIGGATQRSVTITNTSVADYQKNGITLSGNVAGTIRSSVVTGQGAVGVPYAAQNGIQIGFGATADIRGNTISGNNYTPASYVACGILFYQAGGVKASANTTFNNERDNCNYGKGGGIFNPTP